MAKMETWKRSYYSAKNRCENKNNDSYKHYGGKGVKFKMTKDDFKFLFNRDKGHLMNQPSIDRIESKGNYELSNCRYIEKYDNSMRVLDELKKLNAEQIAVIRQEYFGGISKQKELAKRFGVHFSTISKVVVGFSWKRSGRPNNKPIWPECRNGHKYTKETTSKNSRGYRKCLTCQKKNDKRAYVKRTSSLTAVLGMSEGRS